MANQDPDQKSVFGNITPKRDEADDTPQRRNREKSTGDDVAANDEDAEPGGLRSERPERPSTADDQDNPRTGPIG
jgi:hypothetical protein